MFIGRTYRHANNLPFGTASQRVGLVIIDKKNHPGKGMVKNYIVNFLKIIRKYIYLNSKQIDRLKVFKNGSIIVPLPARDFARPLTAELSRARVKGLTSFNPSCFAAAPRGH